MRDIYCIGDSHVSIFAEDGQVLLLPGSSGKWRQFESVNAGPFLAYNLKEKEEIFRLLGNIGDRDLLLCFGEIDCRAQVKRRCDDGREYQEVVTEIADKYFEAINEIKKRIPTGCTIYILSVTPELQEEPNGYMFKRDGQGFEASYGTLAERTQYKTLFNNIIKQKSEDTGYEYVPLSDSVLSKDGTANEELYFDGIHLNPTKMKEIITKVFKSIDLYNKCFPN